MTSPVYMKDGCLVIEGELCQVATQNLTSVAVMI